MTNIDGQTEILPLLGFPVDSVKAPLIYNPYFASAGINAVVVPMGTRPSELKSLVRALFALENIRGALVTMPHKVSIMGMLDVVSTAAQVAGACNAVKRLPDGRLMGDMFDGAGFVRGVQRKGLKLQGARVLVVGNGGVGCAIAASLAATEVARVTLFDAQTSVCEALGQRLKSEYPEIEVVTGNNDPAGHDLVVNATPMGMNEGDPLPMDVSRLSPQTFVGEVVMKTEMTAFLRAAQARGCPVQIGTDMLFEQIPAYLEFFDLPTATADALRSVARLSY